MTRFADQNELIKFARDFVKQRINSLEKDVTYCLLEINSPIKYAPFPTILYCFSTIDLLGALCEGDATRNAKTVSNSKNYMRRFMNYTKEQCDLLLDIYRHKMVHLAQPRFVYQDSNGRKITWQYYHDNPEKHLLIEKIPSGTSLHITSSWSISVDHVFQIGIKQFMNDIKESTEKPQGYLHLLELTKDLQDNFSTAIEQIHL